MKAVRFHGKRDIRIEEVEKPKLGKGQVLVSYMQWSHFPALL